MRLLISVKNTYNITRITVIDEITNEVYFFFHLKLDYWLSKTSYVANLNEYVAEYNLDLFRIFDCNNITLNELCISIKDNEQVSNLSLKFNDISKETSDQVINMLSDFKNKEVITYTEFKELKTLMLNNKYNSSTIFKNNDVQNIESLVESKRKVNE